ncbi:MAG: hypothetical protein LDL33_02150 [Desulfomonile sp.]|nr:hypothetical protein [Desulfomonile sp.]
MAKRTVNAKEVVRDVRAGMDDTGLIEKYGLSPEWLPIMFSKLVDAGLITRAELDQRLHSSEWSHLIDTGDLSELEETTHIDEFEKTVDLRELERAELFEESDKLPPSPPYPLVKKRPKPVVQPQADPASDTTTGSMAQRQLLVDIRKGMHYHTLMQKYRLSEEDLRNRVNRLVATGRLSRSELDHWSPLSQPSLLVETQSLKDEPTATVDLSRFVERKSQPDSAAKAHSSAPAVAQAPQAPAIPEDVINALNDFTRWWTRKQSELPASRPIFKRANLVTRNIRLSEDLLEAAQAKAGREAARTGGDLNSLIEFLLWEFLDRDPRFVQ